MSKMQAMESPYKIYQNPSKATLVGQTYSRIPHFDHTMGFKDGGDEELRLGQLQEINKGEVQQVMSHLNQKMNRQKSNDI